MGPLLGVDLRNGIMNLGYRYMPKSLSHGMDEDIHSFMLGVRFF